MPIRTPAQTVREAKNLAANHGCMVVEKDGKYLVYRKNPARPIYLGLRSTPEALRTFVRKVTSAH